MLHWSKFILRWERDFEFPPSLQTDLSASPQFLGRPPNPDIVFLKLVCKDLQDLWKQENEYVFCNDKLQPRSHSSHWSKTKFIRASYPFNIPVTSKIYIKINHGK